MRRLPVFGNKNILETHFRLLEKKRKRKKIEPVVTGGDVQEPPDIVQTLPSSTQEDVIPSFLSLLDTPDEYGAEGQVVKQGSGSLYFDNMVFTELLDTPANYTDAGGKLVAVKSTEDGLEFIPQPPVYDQFTDLLDTPNSYTGSALKQLRVKSDETGIEFVEKEFVNGKDYSDLDTAIANLNGRMLYLPAGNYVLNNDVTISGTLIIRAEQGAVVTMNGSLRPSAGSVLFIDGGEWNGNVTSKRLINAIVEDGLRYCYFYNAIFRCANNTTTELMWFDEAVVVFDRCKLYWDTANPSSTLYALQVNRGDSSVRKCFVLMQNSEFYGKMSSTTRSFRFQSCDVFFFNNKFVDGYFGQFINLVSGFDTYVVVSNNSFVLTTTLNASGSSSAPMIRFAHNVFGIATNNNLVVPLNNDRQAYFLVVTASAKAVVVANNQVRNAGVYLSAVEADYAGKQGVAVIANNVCQNPMMGLVWSYNHEKLYIVGNNVSATPDHWDTVVWDTIYRPFAMNILNNRLTAGHTAPDADNPLPIVVANNVISGFPNGILYITASGVADTEYVYHSLFIRNNTFLNISDKVFSSTAKSGYETFVTKTESRYTAILCNVNTSWSGYYYNVNRLLQFVIDGNVFINTYRCLTVNRVRYPSFGYIRFVNNTFWSSNTVSPIIALLSNGASETLNALWIDNCNIDNTGDLLTAQYADGIRITRSYIRNIATTVTGVSDLKMGMVIYEQGDGSLYTPLSVSAVGVDLNVNIQGGLAISNGQLYYNLNNTWTKVTHVSGAGTTFPLSPTQGELFYRTDLTEFYVYNGTTWIRIGASNFLQLSDTPSSYTGQGGKLVAVKATEDGLEFVAQSPTYDQFTDLTDTPADYTGAGGKLVVVKATEDGLEFVAQPPTYDQFTDLLDTPSSYTGQGGKLVAVKATEDGLEFVAQPPTYDQFTDLTDTPQNYTGAGGKLVAVKTTEDGLEFIAQPPTYDQFTDLLDTPSGYTGQSGKVVKVKSTEDGLEFGDGGATNFLGLTDTPASYAGSAGKFVVVNSTADGLDFTAVAPEDRPKWIYANDYADFNQALNQVTTKNVIYCPAGTYTMSDNFVNANVDVTIILEAGAVLNMNSKRISVRNLRLISNSQNYVYTKIDNCAGLDAKELIMENVYITFVNTGVTMFSITGSLLYMKNCYVGLPSSGTYFAGNTNLIIHVINCQFYGSSASVVWGGSCKTAFISNSYFNGVRLYITTSGTNRAIVTDTYVYLSSSSWSVGNSGIYVSNGVIANCYGNGSAVSANLLPIIFYVGQGVIANCYLYRGTAKVAGYGIVTGCLFDRPMVALQIEGGGIVKGNRFYNTLTEYDSVTDFTPFTGSDYNFNNLSFGSAIAVSAISFTDPYQTLLIEGNLIRNYPKAGVAIGDAGSSTSDRSIVIRGNVFDTVTPEFMSSTAQTNFNNTVPDGSRGVVVYTCINGSNMTTQVNMSLRIKDNVYRKCYRGFRQSLMLNVTGQWVFDNNEYEAYSTADFLVASSQTGYSLPTILITNNKSSGALTVNIDYGSVVRIIKNISIGNASPFTVTNTSTVTLDDNSIIT